jgi:thioesterase domain-containing protein
VDEIRTVQPAGPYFIGGHCFGGKVAFEMARLLHARGERVALLAMIDAFAPGYLKLLPWTERKVRQRFAYHWNNLKGLSAGERWSYFLDKGKIAGERTERLAKRLIAKLYVALGIPLPPPLQNVYKRKRPILDYERKPYAGKITVFSPAIGPKTYYFDPHMGWEGMAAEGVEIHRVPGRVAKIIAEPSAKTLAEQLQACIDRVLADDGDARAAQIPQPVSSHPENHDGK